MNLKEAIRDRERIVQWICENSNAGSLDSVERVRVLVDELIQVDLITGVPESWDDE